MFPKSEPVQSTATSSERTFHPLHGDAAVVVVAAAVVVSDELLLVESDVDVALLEPPASRIDGTVTATATMAARRMPTMTMQMTRPAVLPPPPPPAAPPAAAPANPVGRAP